MFDYWNIYMYKNNIETNLHLPSLTDSTTNRMYDSTYKLFPVFDNYFINLV